MPESSPNPRPFDDDLAVVIGINQYQNGIPELKTAQCDAERLAKILETKHDYQVKLFIDKQATSNNIWNYLKTELSEKIKQDKNKQVRLLFYFAGHGTAPQGEDGEAGYLLPQDAEVNKHDKYLSMKEIHDVLTQLGCHHLLIILDCCYAGAFRFGTRDLGSSPEELSKERYERYKKEKVGQVITSAAHDQKALDILEAVRKLKDDRGTYENYNHSPFAWLLFKALEEGDADCTKDGITTVTELNLYLSEKLRELTEKQNKPQVSRTWCLPTLDKGEFFFQTGEFDPTKLPEAINLNKDNNPYRGLESFEEAHSRLFFGRSKEIDSLYEKIDYKNQPLTVVLGISGSGKSSLVQAGLIPKLRENPTQWRLLEPIRPGVTPFKALAKAVLPLTLEDSDPDIEPLTQIDAVLRQARKKAPNDNNLNNLFAQWRGSAPENKLLLIIKNFARLKELCGDRIGQTTPEELRKMGLSRSRLVLDNFDELKQNNDSAEQKQLLNSEEQKQLTSFYEECSKKIQDWSEEWQKDGEKFGKFVENYVKDKKILLVIDQFEELITQCHQEERKQFLNALQAALKSSSQQLRLVLTLRDDFRHDFENCEQLQEYWKKACFPVTSMGRDQLREAIEQPALAQVLYFEEKNGESLVNQLLNDIGDTSGVLPLLSFTLSELYCQYVEKARNDRTLRWEDYDKLGGVTKALTSKATEEYNNLKYNFKNSQAVEIDPLEVQARQIMLRWVMLRMVTQDGGVPTKRAVLDAELVYADEKNKKICKLVIARFVDARLFVRGTNQKEDKYIEPAHDVLIREWGLLKEWLTVEQENLVLQKRLAAPTLDWNSTKDRQFLWKQDPRIQLLENIAKSENNWLNKLEMDFVKACVEYREQQEQERLDANLEIGIASSQRLFDAGNKFDALTTLIKTAKTLKHELERYEFSRLYFLISFRDIFGELETCKSIAAHEGTVTSISFNYHKNIIASSDSKTIKLWNTDGTIRQTLQKKIDNKIQDLDFSHSGEFLAAADENGNIDLWQTSKNSTEYEIEKDTFLFHKKFSRYHAANCISFNPDDKTLVSCDGSTVIHWTAEESSVDPLTILGDTTSKSNDVSATCVAFSPDGEIIAAGYTNGVVKLWKYDKKIPTTKAAGSGSVNSINFSHNGETLVVGCANELQFWSTKEESIKPRLTHVLNADVRYVIFSPDDNLLALVDTKNVITLWLKNDKDWLNSDTEFKKFRTLKHEDSYDKSIEKICFLTNLDRPISIAYNYGNTIQFWNCIDKFSGYCQDDEKFYGHTDKIMSIALSGDGKTIVTTSLDRTIKVWSNSGMLLETLHNGKNGYYPRDRVKISRDGQTIIAVLGIGKVIVWRRNENLRYDKIYEKEEFISEFDLSPGGDSYLIVSQDNAVMKVFILRENRYQLIFEEPNQTKVNFDSTGEVITSVNADKIVNIWRFKGVSLVKNNSGFGNNVQYANLLHNDSLTSTAYKSWVVTVDGNSGLNFWKVDGELDRQVKRDIEARIIDLQFTGKTILILSESSTGEFYVELYRLSGASTKTIPLAYGILSTISLNIDCKVIAVADSEVNDYENRVRLLNLDIANLEQVLATPQSGIRSKFEIINEQIVQLL